MVVPDPSMAAVHGVVVVSGGELVLLSSGRTYLLIGGGGEEGAAPITHPRFPLQKDAIIKCGACSLAVTDICLSGAGSAGTGALTGGGPADEERAALARATAADSVCYICFEEGDDIAPLLRSPCVCAKAVHRSCLARWIATKGSRYCSICRSKVGGGGDCTSGGAGWSVCVRVSHPPPPLLSHPSCRLISPCPRRTLCCRWSATCAACTGRGSGST